MNDIKQRIEQLRGLRLAGVDADELERGIIQDMANLSWEEIGRLRGEICPDWFAPEWYDPKSGDSYKDQRETYYAELAIGSIKSAVLTIVLKNVLRSWMA